jgi:type II secretory pathway predicted ATPase ExeA
MDLATTGLHKQPFRTHGAPLVWVPYASQQAAVRFLEAIRTNARGLGLLHGPPLSGKTSIIRHFTTSLPEDQAVAIVDGAGMRANVLLQDMLKQFGFDLDLRSTNERFNMVKVFAMQQAANDRAPLLVIEKAHQLKPDALSVLCELAVLAVKRNSALRIVLASDQPMSPIVQASAMRPISDRLTGQFLLQPLTRPETTHYVYKKLISGGCGDPGGVLPRAVCDALHAASGGWPGIVDRLALLTLARAESFPVRVEHIPRRPKAAEASHGVAVLEPTVSAPKALDNRIAGPRLILTSSGKTLQKITMDRPRLLIGRAEHNDLCIIGDLISRQHAILVRSSNTTFILDLKSRNGTYVNGKQVSGQVLIHHDIISLGDHRLKFIDPAARRRTTLKSAGIDETTIARSIEGLRENIAKRWGTRCAS